LALQVPHAAGNRREGLSRGEVRLANGQYPGRGARSASRGARYVRTGASGWQPDSTHCRNDTNVGDAEIVPR